MNIERYYERFSDQLNSRASKFKASLQNVVHSVDYARTIASLTREIFSADVERKLWIDRFGLVYCAFNVPSDLFVTPIKALFSIDDWELDDLPDEDFWGPESPWGNSFFGRHNLSVGVVQVHFVGDKYPEAANPTCHKRASNVVLVSNDFLEYLEESDEHIAADDDEDDFDTNDARFQAFLSHNRLAIARIFGIGSALIEMAPWYCSAILELGLLTQQSKHRGQHVYLVPGQLVPGAYPGVFPGGVLFRFSARGRFAPQGFTPLRMRSPAHIFALAGSLRTSAKGSLPQGRTSSETFAPALSPYRVGNPRKQASHTERKQSAECET
jgi:hypothetical protein